MHCIHMHDIRALHPYAWHSCIAFTCITCMRCIIFEEDLKIKMIRFFVKQIYNSLLFTFLFKDHKKPISKRAKFHYMHTLHHLWRGSRNKKILRFYFCSLSSSKIIHKIKSLFSKREKLSLHTCIEILHCIFFTFLPHFTKLRRWSKKIKIIMCFRHMISKIFAFIHAFFCMSFSIINHTSLKPNKLVWVVSPSCMSFRK